MPLSFRKLFQIVKPSSHWSENGSHDQPGSASRRFRRSGSIMSLRALCVPTQFTERITIVGLITFWHSTMIFSFGELFQMGEALLPLIVKTSHDQPGSASKRCRRSVSISSLQLL